MEIGFPGPKGGVFLCARVVKDQHNKHKTETDTRHQDTSNGVVVGTTGNGAGEDGEALGEGPSGGHYRRQADADGGCGTAVDPKDDASVTVVSRWRLALGVPNLTIPVPPHLRSSLSIRNATIPKSSCDLRPFPLPLPPLPVPPS